MNPASLEGKHQALNTGEAFTAAVLLPPRGC